jgi:predicted TIM-barrel fold metal-dependent hydrolase
MYSLPREDWLALHTEEIIEPDRRIIDAHHHLWHRPSLKYLFEEYASDIATGHNIVGTVFIDSQAMYRATGPESFRPVGEVEYANGVAAMAASGAYGPAQVCAAIIGTADLMLGAAVKPVLEAQIAAGNGRFRGIRRLTAWDGDPDLMANLVKRQPHMMMDPSSRQGFRCLHELGLSFDAFLFHPQIPELINLAQAFPETPIVLEHVGGPVGLASYARNPAETFQVWKSSLQDLAKRQNVWVKLGGLGMRLSGFRFEEKERPPTSEQLAEAWGPHIHTCIEAFGPSRCMFESNFPPGKGVCSYPVLWNALKRISARYSADERDQMFFRSALNFYRIDPSAVDPADAAV